MKKQKFLAFILALILMLSIVSSLIVQRVSATPEEGLRIKLPFFTSWEWELGQTYGRNNSVDWEKDFSSPELDDVDNQIQPPSPEIFGYKFGGRQLRAAGHFDSSYSYCYFNLFDMTPYSDIKPPFKIRNHTFISIFYYHANLSHSMIDAQLYNSETHQYWTLRDFRLVKHINGYTIYKYVEDQNGTRIHPGYRYNDTVGSWQFASFDLSIIYEDSPNWYVTKIWIGFDNTIDPQHPTGQARTYFDMLHITYAVGDKKTITWENEYGYYNVWLSAAIEAWEYVYWTYTGTYDLALKVSISGFSEGYAKESGHRAESRLPYKLRVSTTASAEAQDIPQPTGVNLTQVNGTVGPGKAEMFLVNLATILVGLEYAPAGWALEAVELAATFAGLIYEEPEALYEWPHPVRWWEEGTTQPPPNIIHGEVYILVSSLTEGLNSIPITFEVDTCLAFYETVPGYWWPGASMTESLALNITWNTTPDDVNLPPDPPSTPSGSASGYTYTTYNYSTNTTDPEGADVRYEFWWGDDTTTTTGWYASGENATAFHHWTSPRTYYVKVRAQDYNGYLNGYWSDWSPCLTVSILPNPSVQTHRYWVMLGEIDTSGQVGPFPPWFWDAPFRTREPYLMPLLTNWNITFSEPHPETGVVYLTVPHETYVGEKHVFWDDTFGWCRWQVSMLEDGFGWLFTGTGTSPILGDVDYYTFSNNTGVYWGPESSKAEELSAPTGAFPDPGPDGVAGTADDGFGDGINDPPGSSVLYLPATLLVYHAAAYTDWKWMPLFSAPWPQVMTTGTAYNIIIEPDSDINGANSTETGQPWEFFAGVDHPEYDPVPWGHPKSNAYVTYACVWSVLEIDTTFGPLDMLYRVVEKLVRDDVLIADINCDEVCNIIDQVICALAFDTQDEGVGLDGVPGTDDDKPVADPGYDARGDLKPDRGLVNIVDIVRINLDFDEKLEP